jgi:hypothetical protein
MGHHANRRHSAGGSHVYASDCRTAVCPFDKPHISRMETRLDSGCINAKSSRTLCFALTSVGRIHAWTTRPNNLQQALIA